MTILTCSKDDTFGPTIQGCRDDFDFTIKFERIFFALVPGSIFILVFLTRILSLIRQRPIVNGTMLLSAKLVSKDNYGFNSYV
jgi:ATP-binding cassette subfamily C (CFTR/MRP) protein 1